MRPCHELVSSLSILYASLQSSSGFGVVGDPPSQSESPFQMTLVTSGAEPEKVAFILSSKTSPAGIDPSKDLLSTVHVVPDPETSPRGVSKESAGLSSPMTTFQLWRSSLAVRVRRPCQEPSSLVSIVKISLQSPSGSGVGLSSPHISFPLKPILLTSGLAPLNLASNLNSSTCPSSSSSSQDLPLPEISTKGLEIASTGASNERSTSQPTMCESAVMVTSPFQAPASSDSMTKNPSQSPWPCTLAGWAEVPRLDKRRGSRKIKHWPRSPIL